MGNWTVKGRVTRINYILKLIKKEKLFLKVFDNISVSLYFFIFLVSIRDFQKHWKKISIIYFIPRSTCILNEDELVDQVSHLL